MSSGGRRGKELTPSEKNLIAQFLMPNTTNGVINRGKQAETTSSFGVSRRTIKYLWAAVKQQHSIGQPVVFISKKEGIKHHRRLNAVLDEEKMMAIPFRKRGTIRKLAREMQCSKSTIGRWVKTGIINAHTNAMHPAITDGNKVQRLKYCLNALEFDNNNNKIKFQTMQNVVHIDEKWFYMSKETTRSYKLPSEVAPYRSCKSKRFILKVMFMCAVARPLYSNDGALLFDGKLGIFPFTKEESAQRNSRNRPRGTLVTKAIDSITKEVIRSCLINQIIPAIKAKWPVGASKHIYIQQDNARPHINNLDPEFRAVANLDGFNITLICQPPNSPDTNVNDLGWFNAIQTLQVDTASYNVADLVKNVILSYEKLSHIGLNNVFLSLQATMIEIMKRKGHSDFKLTHMNKAALLRKGTLPSTLEVEEVLVRECIEYLMEGGHIEHAAYDFSSLLSGLGYD